MLATDKLVAKGTGFVVRWFVVRIFYAHWADKSAPHSVGLIKGDGQCLQLHLPG